MEISHMNPKSTSIFSQPLFLFVMNNLLNLIIFRDFASDAPAMLDWTSGDPGRPLLSYGIETLEPPSPRGLICLSVTLSSARR